VVFLTQVVEFVHHVGDEVETTDDDGFGQRFGVVLQIVHERLAFDELLLLLDHFHVPKVRTDRSEHFKDDERADQIDVFSSECGVTDLHNLIVEGRDLKLLEFAYGLDADCDVRDVVFRT